MKTLPLLAVALFVSTVSFGQTVTDQYSTTRAPTNFTADIVTSQRIGARDVNVDGGLRLSPTGTPIMRSYQGSRSFDFPAVSGAGGANACSVSYPVVTTGSKFRDFCSVSTNLGMDGGTAEPLEAQFTCRVVTDATYVKLCVFFADGGTLDLPDAGYQVITWGP